MQKNWKSTAIGLVSAAVGIGSLYSQNPPVDLAEWINFLGQISPLLGLGGLGIVAADARPVAKPPSQPLGRI